MFKIPLFPSYIRTKLLIKCLNRKNESEYKSMWNAIWDLCGTQPENVNFTVDNSYFAEGEDVGGEGLILYFNNRILE